MKKNDDQESAYAGCPSSAQWGALLQLGFADSFSLRLRDHLRQCQVCQGLLDDLTSAPSLELMRKSLNREQSPPELTQHRGVGEELLELVAAGDPVQKAKRFVLQWLVTQSSQELTCPVQLRADYSVKDDSADRKPQISPGLGNEKRSTDAGGNSYETKHEPERHRPGEFDLPKKIGPYDVLGLLGSGGMGTVFYGFDPRVNRQVAIKTIHPSRPELQDRLTREAEAVARIDHANVVRLFALETIEPGLSFNGPPETVLVLEYVAGQTLAQRLADQGKLTSTEAAKILVAVAAGVQAAHGCGVLHRDIKPSNILLDMQGGVKIADFGLAAFTELTARLTRENTVPGTPAYLSPELARGGRPTVASDVYSLGCVLHECLTGQPAFPGKSDEIPYRLGRNVVPPLPLSGSDTPVELAVIRNCAMSVEPTLRYVSADAFANDLNRWLNGESISARPETILQRSWRHIRRHPRRVASVAVALAVTLTIAGWGWHSMRQSQVNEELARIAVEQVSSQTAEADRQRELALKQLLASVFETQDMLKDRAGTLELRRSLLVEAIKGLEQVSQSKVSSSEPQSLDRSIAIAHLRLGQIQLALGDAKAGRNSLELARAIAAEVPIDSPTDTTSCRDLAAILTSLAEAEFDQRNFAGTQEFLMQSVTLRKIALELDPENPDALAKYHANLIRLGDVAKAIGDLPKSKDYFQQVAELTEDAVLRFPGEMILQRSAANALSRLLVIAMNEGDAQLARQRVDRYQQRVGELLRHEPLNLEYQYDNALALGQSARISVLEGHFETAAQTADRASQAYRAIALAEPNNGTAQSRLAISLHNEADAWYATGQFEQALDRWSEAAEIQDQLFAENPSNTRLALLGGESWMWRGLTKLSQGNVDSALESLNRAYMTLKAGEAGARNQPQIVAANEAVRSLVDQLTQARELTRSEPGNRRGADPTVSAMCGYLLSRTGQMEDAVELADHWSGFLTEDSAVMVNVHSLRAAIYVAAMEKVKGARRAEFRELALVALRATLEANPGWRTIMWKSPDFLLLREEPGYQELCSSPR